jgi:ABC-type transport system involved in multi-copper enzyme maturation permease subunit
MVLEKQIEPFGDWLASRGLQFLLVAAVLIALALIAGYLMAAARNGPREALTIVARIVRDAWTDLAHLSLRRILAMARLAIKEAVRRYVLVVFLVFVIILMFAGWYLDVESDNPGPLYLSFVLKSTNFLTILLAMFLSSFSIPNDMKNKTIFTVVTKPIRPWEIIAGRIVGFSAVGTVILAMMCVCSFIFVTRGLHHEHDVELASVEVTPGETGTVSGQTTRDAHHRHEFSLGPDGRGETDSRMGHRHEVASSQTAGAAGTFHIGPPRGALQARVPIYGKLRFLDRSGKPTDKGINVGQEWTYRGYVEGRSLSAGIWRFENLKSRDFPDRLPIEMTIRVFRTYKGDIERGILGTLQLLNGNPAVQAAALNTDPATRRGFDPDTAVKSEPIPFYAQDFTAVQQDIDRRRVLARMLDGTTREVDIFESLVHDGTLEIKVQCEEPAQYYGMAQADLYLRAADHWFWVNFIKTYLTIWLQVVVVTSFGVMFSTFLTGSVAMLATLGSIVIGYFSQTIFDVASGRLEGGGPAESLVRIFRQWNLVTELEGGVTRVLIKAFDAVTMAVMQAISYVMPNFRDFAEYGGINTVRFLAYGFDIPLNLMSQHFLVALAYVLAATCGGYFFFKTKEIAG